VGIGDALCFTNTMLEADNWKIVFKVYDGSRFGSYSRLLTHCDKADSRRGANEYGRYRRLDLAIEGVFRTLILQGGPQVLSPNNRWRTQTQQGRKLHQLGVKV
jgi:hypothetical protein